MTRPKTGDDEGFAKFEKFLEHWSRRDFLKRTGGAAAYAAFMAGGAELLAACGPVPNAQPSPSPKKGGHIVEAWPTDVRHFMSPLISDANSQIVSGLISEGLLTRQANGDLLPGLAKEVPKVSSDQLSYTFKLRQEAKWSDGQPVTADDVVFTYRLMYDPAYREVNSPRRGDLEKYIESVSAPDKYTVVVKTKKPFAPFLPTHGLYRVVPKHVLGDLPARALNTAPFDSSPTVSCGPFKFAKWDKGQQVVLERNDTYWRGAPNLDRFVYKVVADTLQVGNQLQTGEADTGFFDVSLVDRMRSASNVDVRIFSGPNFDYYAYQVDPAKPAAQFFGDKKVRQALLYALDRQKMAQTVYFGQAEVATGFEPTPSWAYEANLTPRYGFDRNKAERLLDEAGWKRGASGTREKNGVPFKFEMLTNAGNKARENLLVVMQQQWKQIGVEATPRPIQFQQLVTQLTNIRTFDMFLIGFTLDADPDQSQNWSTAAAAPGGFNAMPYKNSEVDTLFEQAATTFDRGKRKDIYRKIQSIFAEDAVAPILVYPKRVWGVSKRVQNFNVGPFTQYAERPWMKDVFVTDGK